MVPSIIFQTFLFRHLNFSETLENSVCYCYICYEMTDQFFMISGSKEQLQQQLGYTLLKPDCHCWWISKRQSGREDTLEKRYSIKFCFKLGKMPQKRMECFRLLLNHLAWIEHQVLSGKRDSRKTRNLWGMMRGVGGQGSQYTRVDRPKGLG